jgi:plasmid stabilization system protein ParE
MAAEFLELQKAGGGSRFREDLARMVALLEQFPEMAQLYEPPNPRFPGLRVARLTKFRHYAVFYCPETPGIRIIRVLHTSRDIVAIFAPATS